MNKRALLFTMLFLTSCVPDMTPPKSVIKKIENRSVLLEWFTFSSAYANTPDYITLEEDGHLDTICIATNVHDIDIKGDTVFLFFRGRPGFYDSIIHLPANVRGSKIIIDTVGK